MKIKDKRSILFLFIAMLASSLIIGSYCQTRFAPVENLAQYAEPDKAKQEKLPQKNKKDQQKMEKEGVFLN